MTAQPPSARDRILAAAIELFLAQGVEGVSVAEVCRAAGVSNGSFFHHFPSKDELALEIVLALRREYWDYLLAVMEPCSDAMEGVANVVRAAFAYQRLHPDRYRLSRSDDALWMRGQEQRFRDDNAPYRGRAGQWIANHVAAGRLPLLLPEIYGALLFGTPHWVARNAHSGAEPTDFNAAEAQLVQTVQKALKV
ncbi:TetR/AcrR family transcriptional regulator [Terricaulis silvestris]|uniref:HTH-type transcriptional repressor KstR2 n=1 Tax=Terricaulis silvestris TaxID=2686094 RepID=A0A6I6MST9_9CAUL|nr:TetR/AcrR family transcriptional regulator [Terricaulis silvestris]QGZ96408.1 HTH-type transcriptional repressor KstR2 [Terricaulis silvestris]